MGRIVEAGVYPSQYEWAESFPGRLKVMIRPIRPDDQDRLSELFASHSKQTIYQRYLTHLKKIPDDVLHKFVTVDYLNDMALVACRASGRAAGSFLAVGRYFKNPRTGFAEVAITVDDPYQKKGVGICLLKKLKKIALETGIKGFTASMLATNKGMIRLFSHVLGKHEFHYADGLYHVRKAFAPAKKNLGK